MAKQVIIIVVFILEVSWCPGTSTKRFQSSAENVLCKVVAEVFTEIYDAGGTFDDKLETL